MGQTYTIHCIHRCADIVSYEGLLLVLYMHTCAIELADVISQTSRG